MRLWFSGDSREEAASPRANVNDQRRRSPNPRAAADDKNAPVSKSFPMHAKYNRNASE
jgi:hypothetical protein